MIRSPRVRFARTTVAAALAIAALTLVLAAAPVAATAGVRNCVDLTRRSPACYELVWVNGVQVKMTFPQSGSQRHSSANAEVHPFYVIAPQTDAAQGSAPFPHDHVVGVSPNQGHGGSGVFWHGYFALCSAEGISTGGCVPTWTSIPGFGSVPLAKTVNGQMLTTVDPLESPENSGVLTLIDTEAEFMGTIDPGNTDPS